MSWLRFISPTIHNAGTQTKLHTHKHSHRCTNTLTDQKTILHAHAYPDNPKSQLVYMPASTHTHTHTHTRTHLKENHNGSTTLSNHLASAQHPSINRKTSSAPQGKKQHLENRLKWGFQAWRCVYKRVWFCFIELYINCVYSSREMPGSNKITMFIVCVCLQRRIWMCHTTCTTLISSECMWM